MKRLMLVAGLWIIGAGAAIANDLNCEPFFEPPAPAVQAAPASPPVEAPAEPIAPPAPQFQRVEGGAELPPLIFLGDSLTLSAGASDASGEYPRRVAGLLGDRKFQVLAIGGQTPSVLATLLDEETIPADAVGVIWLGRTTPGDPEGVERSIAHAMSLFPSGRTLALSVPFGRSPDGLPGGPEHSQIETLNELLNTKFGSDFVSVTAQLDCADFLDGVHFTNSGYQKIADAVAAALQERRW